MPLISERYLKEKFENKISMESFVGNERYSEKASYDIFLSHSYLDKEIVTYIRALFESLDLSVYVDWIDDKQLEREHVCEKTANILRARMKNCKCLFFAVSDNARLSKWMPWECGYFDGMKGKVAILPISDNDSYNGQEYLGLYPYIDIYRDSVYINSTSSPMFQSLDEWLNGE